MKHRYQKIATNSLREGIEKYDRRKGWRGPIQNINLSIKDWPSKIKLKKLEKTLGYPFWIRSTSGSSGLGSLKVENQESLKNWGRQRWRTKSGKKSSFPISTLSLNSTPISEKIFRRFLKTPMEGARPIHLECFTGRTI